MCQDHRPECHMRESNCADINISVSVLIGTKVTDLFIEKNINVFIIGIKFKKNRAQI